jgi:DNA polymerase-1
MTKRKIMNQPTPAPEQDKHHLYLVDGFGFVFRAYHSLPPMTNPEGTPTNAVYGFTNMLLSLKRKAFDEGASRMLVVFDAGSKTFRNDIYKEYKANRPPAPEDLVPQFPLVRDAAEALNLPHLSIKGFEADDIIATYAKIAAEAGHRVTVVSSDKDLMQLVDDETGVEMYDAMKKKVINNAAVQEKFGVPPHHVLDLLAMQGDSSDNIPGVPGIGPKTAAELINTYGDLEDVLKNADKVKQNKRRENLIEFADQARLSRELATLRYDVPVDIALDDMDIQEEDEDDLLAFLSKQGFKSLIAKHCNGAKPLEVVKASADGETTAPAPKEVKQDYKLITDAATLNEWLANCKRTGLLAQQWKRDKSGAIFGYTFAHSAGNACYVPCAHKKPNAQEDLFGDAVPDAGYPQLSKDAVEQELARYIVDATVLKIGHDIKPLRNISPAEDISIMSYVLDGTKHKHDLENLADVHLSLDVALPEELRKSKTPITAEDPADVAKLFCAQADGIIRLHGLFKQRLFAEKMLTVYETIERPLVQVLSDMEVEGIKLNQPVLKDMSTDFAKRIADLTTGIHALAGKDFNIGSPKQMGEILFDDMGIEGGKKSKNGAYKTGVEILEELSANGHVIAEKILQWRSLSKLMSTYTEALQKAVNPETGRVHTTFSMHSTSTGRLSSVDPNLQNIPIRTEEGRKIRTAFVAKEGCMLVGADYSQIELRLLAHMAGINTLKTAFNEGLDIHTKTASQVFGVPVEEVSGDMRRNAKAINFGIIYGQSAFGLAAQLGISRTDAKIYIDNYFEQYPGIRHFMETTKEYAREHGYVKTLFGRKCFLNGIDSSNGMQRAFAERAAINAPLQGTAADIIKKAMINLHARLKAENIDANILLQVHDELIIEVAEDHTERVMEMTRTEMEQVATLSIPLTTDVKSGKHWGEIH